MNNLVTDDENKNTRDDEPAIGNNTQAFPVKAQSQHPTNESREPVTALNSTIQQPLERRLQASLGIY